MKKSTVALARRTSAVTSKLSIMLGSLLLAFSGMASEITSYKLDADKRHQVVESIITQLQQAYVFPDRAADMGKILRRKLQNKDFQRFIDANEFAKTLTAQLQQETGDKHLVVEFSERSIPVKEDAEALAQEEAYEMAMWRAHNFGFERIERMRFNIGYLKLSAFGPVKEVGPLLASAMNLVNNADSLVIDLRGNFGGHEQTVQLLASYLLNKRTHLLSMHKRKDNVIEQHWSSDYVQGQRFAQEKDVYILIDKDSFSAAEDFSYTMKNLKRATLIGEVTGGAANSGDMVRLTEHFSLFLPTARGVSPITNTNWEGTGVVPDIRVSGKQALKAAQIEILNKLMATEKDKRRVERIKAFIAELKA